MSIRSMRDKVGAWMFYQEPIVFGQFWPNFMIGFRRGIRIAYGALVWIPLNVLVLIMIICEQLATVVIDTEEPEEKMRREAREAVERWRKVRSKDWDKFD